MYHLMKTYRGVQIWLYRFLNSAINRGQTLPLPKIEPCIPQPLAISTELSCFMQLDANFILVGCILLRNVYMALLIIHLQSQLRVLLTYSSLLHSQHVSTPSGHRQLNHNMLYLVTHLQKTIATSTDPFFLKMVSVHFITNR
jgi:hypothetical protein